MTIKFDKYQACGNDFIFPEPDAFNWLMNDQKKLEALCDRHFGIGADGVIWIMPSAGASSFEMLYFNADGLPGSFCGNGSRCALLDAFRKHLIEPDKPVFFKAFDGLHEALISGESIRVSMHVKTLPEAFGNDYLLDTGSPHYIRYVPNPDALDLVAEGRKIRYSAPFIEQGINVNFIHAETPHKLRIRTYERGVENETLACGTGVTAAALVHAHASGLNEGSVSVYARGGLLRVDFSSTDGHFKDVFLSGHAAHVYSGNINL